MSYDMRLIDEELNRRFFFVGFKTIRDGSVRRLWQDTTTLYISLYEGDDASGRLLGKGIMRIRAADFARLGDEGEAGVDGR